MKYRVIVKVGYHEAWFDFEGIQAAGEFAKTVLTHQAENEDTPKRTSVTIRVIAEGTEEGDPNVSAD